MPPGRSRRTATPTIREPQSRSICTQSYYAKVRFNGKREEHGETIECAGTADLHRYRAESFQVGARYGLIPGCSHTRVEFDKWDVRSDSIGCQLVSKASAASSDVP